MKCSGHAREPEGKWLCKDCGGETKSEVPIIIVEKERSSSVSAPPEVGVVPVLIKEPEPVIPESLPTPSPEPVKQEVLEVKKNMPQPSALSSHTMSEAEALGASFHDIIRQENSNHQNPFPSDDESIVLSGALI